jgi:uncharacterized protein YciI
MFYIVFATDKPNSTKLRADTRPEHMEYLKGCGDMIVAGGATLTDDGEGMTGSFLLVDVPDRAAAEEFARNDPFAKAGLFATTEIKRWRKGIWNPPKD